jgi:hypothetical protein
MHHSEILLNMVKDYLNASGFWLEEALPGRMVSFTDPTLIFLE